MNYGIGAGGGFGVSVPLNRFADNHSFAPYQPQPGNGMQGATWSQPTIGYSQPAYGQTSGWYYTQPTNQAWSTVQPTAWSGQTYVQPHQAHYPPPQQYSFHSMPFTPGCGNCGHTKPAIRRDW
jgi:hypothetical protein